MLENLIEYVEEYGKFYDDFADIIKTGWDLREILEELAEFFGGCTESKIEATIYCHDIGESGFKYWTDFTKDDINEYAIPVWDLLTSGPLNID